MGEMIASYGSAQEVFHRAREGQLVYAGREKKNPIKALEQSAEENRIDKLLHSYEAAGIEPVSRISKNYPALLKEIYDPPEMLFVKGRLLPMLRLPIAVIGARHCSDYGRETARTFSRELADAGACIVSGMAYGIDCAAAAGALQSESEYPTIAVLGCGVDVVYPKSAAKEYKGIVERGAVVSEFLPGTPPLPSHFPRRNRLISGLSRGTLVVEAGERSGASITVDFALEQGRDVFAVPGRISDAQSAGTNRYIRDGYAKAVLSTQDVLNEYGMEMRKEPAAHADISELPEEQQAIFRILQRGEKNFDELCMLTAYSPSELNSVLTVMEFSGIIRQTSGRMYKL